MSTPTLEQWQKLITHAIYVEGEVQMGTLCEWLARMWDNAFERGALAAKMVVEDKLHEALEQRQTRLEETERD